MGTVLAAPGDTVYVNGSGGQDTNDGSSWLSAKQSIKNATGTVNSNGTVNIANGQYTGDNNTKIIIDKNMTIHGQSQKETIINGTNTNWIFSINSSINVVINNLSITNGNSSSAGIIYNKGTLNVNRISFIGNTATFFGGAIYNWEGATLTVTGSTFTNNSATNSFGDSSGGAIYNFGTLNVTGSNFANNTATRGGDIFNGIGTSTITGCNFTATRGGAICNDMDGIVNAHFNRIVRDSTLSYGNIIFNYDYVDSTIDASLN
jgi:predicted outer membrane repeat protein